MRVGELDPCQVSLLQALRPDCRPCAKSRRDTPELCHAKPMVQLEGEGVRGVELAEPQFSHDPQPIAVGSRLALAPASSITTCAAFTEMFPVGEAMVRPDHATARSGRQRERSPSIARGCARGGNVGRELSRPVLVALAGGRGRDSRRVGASGDRAPSRGDLSQFAGHTDIVRKSLDDQKGMGLSWAVPANSGSENLKQGAV